MVGLSWICERSPISIHSLSPRSTAPHHTLTSDLSRTRPITTAVSAIQYCPSAGNSGETPASSKIGIMALLTGIDTCHAETGLGSRRPSGEQPFERLDRQFHDGAEQHAPEARRHRRQHDVFEPTPLHALSAQGAAHDDERGGKRQKWNREGRRRRSAAEQAKRGRPMGQKLIKDRNTPGNTNAD